MTTILPYFSLLKQVSFCKLTYLAFNYPICLETSVAKSYPIKEKQRKPFCTSVNNNGSFLLRFARCILSQSSFKKVLVHGLHHFNPTIFDILNNKTIRCSPLGVMKSHFRNVNKEFISYFFHKCLPGRMQDFLLKNDLNFSEYIGM